MKKYYAWTEAYDGFGTGLPFSSLCAAQSEALRWVTHSPKPVRAFVTCDGEILGGYFADAQSEEDWRDEPEDIRKFGEMLAGK